MHDHISGPCARRFRPTERSGRPRPVDKHLPHPRRPLDAEPVEHVGRGRRASGPHRRARALERAFERGFLAGFERGRA